MVNTMDKDHCQHFPNSKFYFLKFKEVMRERNRTGFTASAVSFHLTGLMKRITKILFWGGETDFFYIIRNLNTFPSPILNTFKTTGSSFLLCYTSHIL